MNDTNETNDHPFSHDKAGDPCLKYAGLSDDERRVAKENDARRRFQANRERIFDALATAQVNTVVCSYSGNGDEGNIDDIEADKGNFGAVRVLYETCEGRSRRDETVGRWEWIEVESRRSCR